MTIAQLFYQRINIAIFPPNCCLCGLEGRRIRGREPGLAGRWHRIPLDLCETCEATLARAEPRWMTRGTSLQFAFLRYQAPVDQMIQQFKFSGDRALGRALSVGFALARMAERDRPLPRAIVPVPMHRRRFRERGFDHTQLVAQWVGEVCAIPVVRQALVRHRATPAQSRIGRAQRLANVRGAFDIARPEELAGLQHVALLDDVVTTGSTLNAATETLQRTGSIEVEQWVLARTELR